MARRSYFPRVTIHTEYYYRNFLTKTCTVGFAFAMAIRILIIVMPFFLAYSTGSKSKTQDASTHPGPSGPIECSFKSLEHPLWRPSPL